jgi:hypothetical protein
MTERKRPHRAGGPVAAKTFSIITILQIGLAQAQTFDVASCLIGHTFDAAERM